MVPRPVITWVIAVDAGVEEVEEIVEDSHVAECEAPVVTEEASVIAVAMADAVEVEWVAIEEVSLVAEDVVETVEDTEIAVAVAEVATETVAASVEVAVEIVADMEIAEVEAVAQ